MHKVKKDPVFAAALASPSLPGCSTSSSYTNPSWEPPNRALWSGSETMKAASLLMLLASFADWVSLLAFIFHSLSSYLLLDWLSAVYVHLIFRDNWQFWKHLDTHHCLLQNGHSETLKYCRQWLPVHGRASCRICCCRCCAGSATCQHNLG